MRRKDPEGEVPCCARPDFDNLAKAVADCMTALGWWHDDAQIVRATVSKFYHAKSERPGVRVRVHWQEQGK
jgi:Holliday junction resolvase RusA-like endonuclease